MRFAFERESFERESSANAFAIRVSNRESVIFEETLEKRDSRIAIPRKFVKLVIACKAFKKQFN